uniref:Plasma membrane fusion protein PRM1 n=1 Tax=Globodera rostochiensis TaxID=31243 RepID=A0A914H5I0_GLORO
MSVDETIRELSGTLIQLKILVAKINEQISGVSGRINITLQTFDDSVSGIANDANKMTKQVDTTIDQIPGSWAFYTLFFTLIAVLVLLSILILINLIIKIQSIYNTLRGDVSRASTPLQSLVQSESKQPLHTQPFPATFHGQAPESTHRLRHHVAVEMEAEPRRYGLGMPPDVPPQQQQQQHMTSLRSATATTTVYHPGPMAPRQMEYNENRGGGRRSANGSSPNSELRGRSHGGSPRAYQADAGAVD